MSGLVRSFALAAGALAFTAPLVASATVIMPRTIEEMAQDSACVVRGRVLSSEAAWDDKHERIFTNTEIEVLDQIHGPQDAPRRIIVRTLGGEVGKIGMKVAGTERFTLNEEVVLFLRRDPVVASSFQVIGMSQGKYHIEREAKGRAIAIPSTEGLAFARKDESGVYKVDPSMPRVDRIPLDDLRKRVVDAIQQKPQVVPENRLQLKAAPQGNAPQSTPDSAH
jgi:hypothetical protein